VPINRRIQHTLDKIQFLNYRMWYVKLPQRFGVTGRVSEWDANCYLWIWETGHLQNETEPDGAWRSQTACLVPQSVWRGAKDVAEPPALLLPPPTPASMADLQYYCNFATSLKRVFLQLAEIWQVLTVFWDLTPRNMVNTYRRFGATSRDIFGFQA
jgi:hypothetical protein